MEANDDMGVGPIEATSRFGLLAAVVVLLVVGIGKEVYDHFNHGTVDVYDFMATVWGGAAMLGWIEIARAFLQ